MPLHHFISYSAVDGAHFALRLLDALAAGHPEGGRAIGSGPRRGSRGVRFIKIQRPAEVIPAKAGI